MIETDSNYQGLNRMDDPIECHSAANTVLIQDAYVAMQNADHPEWWWNYITVTGKENEG